MALNINRLLTRYLARQLRPLRQALVWTSLCNRDYQADFSGGAYTAKVPKAITDRDAVEVDRNADWEDAEDAGLDYEDKTLTKQSMMASAIPYLDEVQTPVNLIDRERKIHVRGFANRIDKTVADTIVAAVPSGNQETIGHLNQPYLDIRGDWQAESDANNTAAKQDAMMLGVFNFIAGYGVDASEGGWDMDADSPLAVWGVCPPQVARAFNRWLAKQDLTDMVNTQLLKEGRMTGLPSRAFTRIEGTTLMRTPRVPKVAGIYDSTPANVRPPYWQIVLGTRAGASFAAMPAVRQLFSPQQNQTTKMGWLLRGSWIYDCWITYTPTFALLKIPAGPLPTSVEDAGPPPARDPHGEPRTVYTYDDARDPEAEAAEALAAEADPKPKKK